MFGGFVGFAYLCRLMKPTNDLNIRKSVAILVLAATFAACSGDSSDTPTNSYNDSPTNPSGVTEEIRVNADVLRTMEGRRAATFSYATDLQDQDLKISAYFHGKDVAYITDAKLHYDSSDPSPSWKFWSGGAETHYYWPIEGSVYDPSSANIPVSSFDFLGYCPYTTPDYISSLTYNYSTGVSFSCNMSSYFTGAAQGSMTEFVYAYLENQTYSNQVTEGGSLPLTFQHPFARIKLQLAASHPNITINSITFRSIKNNGNYDHSASPKWSTSGDATNFVLSLTGDAADFDDNTASPTQIGSDFIMIPQNWTGEIVVNADCLFWGNKVNYPSLTTTIPTDWQPGYSYTYTFNISPDDLIVNISKYTEQW